MEGLKLIKLNCQLGAIKSSSLSSGQLAPVSVQQITHKGFLDNHKTPHSETHLHHIHTHTYCRSNKYEAISTKGASSFSQSVFSGCSKGFLSFFRAVLLLLLHPSSGSFILYSSWAAPYTPLLLLLNFFCACDSVCPHYLYDWCSPNSLAGHILLSNLQNVFRFLFHFYFFSFPASVPDNSTRNDDLNM